MKPKRKPLKYGVDWHGWCWKHDNGAISVFLIELSREKPKRKVCGSCTNGRWVRVSVKEVER